MTVAKLTGNIVNLLQPGSSTYIRFDSELPGFGCRVTPAGAKSWIVEYRPGNGGRRTGKRRVTIGSTAALPAILARRNAKEILARARLGEDVAAKKASQRTALTVAELSSRYMSEEILPTRKASTAKLYGMYFRRHVFPEFGNRPVRELTRADIARLHRKIGTTSKVTANRVLMLLSGLFAWGVGAGELPDGFKPAKNITRFREQGRERFLSNEELARLGEALREAETSGLPWKLDHQHPQSKHLPKTAQRISTLPRHVTGGLRLLLFTGCRLREILHLKWEQVDFERGMLILPDTKNGRRAVMLSAPAHSILASLPHLGTYVVAGSDPDRPRHDLHRPWRAITARAGLTGLRIHDLRHSFASVAAWGGLGLFVIGKLLGHANQETTARYAHLANDPLRRAAENIGSTILAAMGDNPKQRSEMTYFKNGVVVNSALSVSTGD